MFGISLRGVLAGCVLSMSSLLMADNTITYQGQVMHAGVPFNGEADVEFFLFDEATGGAQIGSNVIMEAHPISDGLIQADLDFGPGAFTGQPRWLEVQVNGLTLTPRQQIRAAPLALHALSSGDEPSPWSMSGSNIYYDGGRVGIGLDEPLAPLHVVGSGVFGNSANSIDGTNNFVTGGTNFAHNTANGTANFIAGGFNNEAAGDYGFLAGEGNKATSIRNFVAGLGNEATADSAFVAGGAYNIANGFQSFVTGNSSQTHGSYSVAMGRQAHALHNGTFVWSDSFTTPFQSTANNQFLINAHGGFAVVGVFETGDIPAEGAGTRLMWYPGKSAFRVGNVNNVQWNDQNIGNYSVAMGRDVRAGGTASLATGFLNSAQGTYSTAMGFSSTASGDRSFALGSFATAQAFNSVVIGRYNELAGLPSTWNSADPLLVAGNGTSTSDRSNALTLLKNGNLTIAGALTENSDRNNKHDIQPVDAGNILEHLKALPLSTWRYNHSPDAVHIGPMAQDFYALFGLGEDDTGIAGIDVSGVALAAIQGLVQHVDQQAEEIRSLRQVLTTQQAHTEQVQAALVERLSVLEDLLIEHRALVKFEPAEN
jgi:hypothetical protein